MEEKGEGGQEANMGGAVPHFLMLADFTHPIKDNLKYTFSSIFSPKA